MGASENNESSVEFAALAFTSSSAAAQKVGILFRAIDIEPKQIATYRGDLLIQDAWIERRMHQVPVKSSPNSDRLLLPDSKTPCFYLCLRHREQTPEEATFGGVWFSGGVQWSGFSHGHYEIKRYRLASGSESEVSLAIISIRDIEVRDGRATPPQGKGLLQTLHLKDKAPNQSKDPTP